MPIYTQPPPCPSCSETMVPIIYGMVTDFDSLPEPCINAGCCVPIPTPIARCEACGREVFEAL
jgi:hypothetical protein